MKKILIVDDSIFSQKITSNLIRQFLNNAEIYFSSDGKEGFKTYKEINPDYVFIDLLMPNLNGKDLIKKIRDYDADAKIIVLTADVQKNVREEIEKYNVLSFINKPFNEEKAKTVCDMIRNDKL
ncbi:response regulator transcription factor [Petroclostridium xylanilyticum]|uniref:response regulator transcription factor n=1 Tax=Petroclostridium xylanilyticum TaxID=1792311 RepID=UPI000B99B687|nr:response regulator [Petroclostridium xylanilyticum]